MASNRTARGERGSLRCVRSRHVRVATPKLVVDGRIEGEWTLPEPRIDTHCITILVYATLGSSAGLVWARGVEAAAARAGTGAGRAGGMEEGEHRLDVETLHRGELRRNDRGEIIPTILGAGDANPDKSILALRPDEIFLDRHVRRLQFKGWADSGVEVDAGEVAVGVGGELVAGRRGEGLSTQAHDHGHRQQRSWELDVEPLDLHDGSDVSVEVEATAGAGLRRNCRGGGGSRVGDGRVVGPRLAPYRVDLEPEHALDLADL